MIKVNHDVRIGSRLESVDKRRMTNVLEHVVVNH